MKSSDKRVAIQRAVDHADRVRASWSERAMQLVRDMMKRRRAFSSEELRDYAKRRGLADPADPRAWGGIILRAKHEGLIAHDGWTTASNPQAHGRPINYWKVVT